MKFIMEVRKFLKKKGIHVQTALEMVEYMEKMYSACEEVTENKYELLSVGFNTKVMYYVQYIIYSTLLVILRLFF